jgi:hypothetical protein
VILDTYDMMLLIDTDCFLMRMAAHEFVLKDFAPYPEVINENHGSIIVGIVGLWVEFLNLIPHEYEADTLITRLPCLVQWC